MLRELLTTALYIVAASLVVAGVALVFIPAAFIVAGLALLAGLIAAERASNHDTEIEATE